MRVLLALALLASTSPALAITETRSGLLVEAAGGGALSSAPFGLHPAWQGGVAVWFGRYDRSYAIGRFWSLGLHLRQDLQRGVLRTAPTLEVRRGLDLIALGLHGFLAAGPEVVPGHVGLRAVAGVGLKYRFRPMLGLTLRLEGGAANGGGDWRGHGGLTIGVAFARPFAKLE